MSRLPVLILICALASSCTEAPEESVNRARFEEGHGGGPVNLGDDPKAMPPMSSAPWRFQPERKPARQGRYAESYEEWFRSFAKLSPDAQSKYFLDNHAPSEWIDFVKTDLKARY